MLNNLKNEKGYVLGTCILGLIALAVVGCIFVGLLGLRMDFESGSHRIIPTAIDRDVWGNYKVYYRTTEYTKNSEEDCYFIDKDNTELAEQMKECIKNGQTVIAYYDKYVGWKGFDAPNTAPITKIEVVEN